MTIFILLIATFLLIAQLWYNFSDPYVLLVTGAWFGASLLALTRKWG